MDRRVLGVLAGEDLPADLLKKWAQEADILIAADGAANRLAALDLVPNVVIGDLDSYTGAQFPTGPEIYQIANQNYTDCDKLLAYAAQKGLFPMAIAGVEGDRLDHVLASLQSIAKSPYREEITLVLRSGLGWILGPGSYIKAASHRGVVSLIPLEQADGVTTDGLQWNLSNDVLSPAGKTSISNRALADRFTLTFEAGTLFVSGQLSEEEMPRW